MTKPYKSFVHDAPQPGASATRMQSTAQAYARVGLETGVSAATPHRIILMLYDGALRSIADAQRHVAAQDIAAKGHALSRAIAIIDQGLAQSLDMRRGGAIALQLQQLYDYAKRRLLHANLNNDLGALAEVANLLAHLRSGWAAIGDKGMPASPTFVPTSA